MPALKPVKKIAVGNSASLNSTFVACDFNVLKVLITLTFLLGSK